MSPFDFLNDINYDKKGIMNEDNKKDYAPFVINRSLSYFNDTVLFANVLNQYHFLEVDLQFAFYINTIRKRKRFSKWVKADSDDSIEVVKEYYDYSEEKARQVLPLLSSEQLRLLKEKVDKGGRK